MIAAGALLLAVASAPDHDVVVGRGADGACWATFDGRPIPSGYDDRAAAAALAAQAGGDLKARLRFDAGSPDLPYRCIGGIIYQLQMAGYQLTMAWVEAPPAR